MYSVENCGAPDQRTKADRDAAEMRQRRAQRRKRNQSKNSPNQAYGGKKKIWPRMR